MKTRIDSESSLNGNSFESAALLLWLQVGLLKKTYFFSKQLLAWNIFDIDKGIEIKVVL